MNTRLKKIGICILLLAGFGMAQADQRQDQNQRDTGRAERQQRMPERNDNIQQNGNQQQSPDQGRRQGRMSPEERQALRRQINEAGQDIYVRPR